MTSRLPSSWPGWAREMTRLFALGAAMGIFGYVVGDLFARLFPDLGSPVLPRWADMVAIPLAAILIFAAAGAATLSFNAAALGRALKLEGAAGSVEARDVRTQSALLGVTGVLVALPPVTMMTRVDPAVAFGVLVVLLALHTALNVKLYRSFDELFRRTVIEAGAITLWAAQGVLFLWAAAERMALAPPLTAWDIYVVMMVVYLAGSTFVTVRRGLG